MSKFMADTKSRSRDSYIPRGSNPPVEVLSSPELAASDAQYSIC